MTRPPDKTKPNAQPQQSGNEVQANLPSAAVGAEHARGETTACPTGMADPQALAAQQAGGGGAPGTGSDPGLTGVPYSPGEGVTEEQRRRSG